MEERSLWGTQFLSEEAMAVLIETRAGKGKEM